MAKVSSLNIEHQNNTDRTVYATWKFSKSHLDHYTVTWYYTTGDGVSFKATSEDIKIKQSVYTPPENALTVKIVVKPVSTKYKDGKKMRPHWTGVAVNDTYNLTTHIIAKPSAPTVTIERYLETGAGGESANKNMFKLVAECTDTDPIARNLNYIEFYAHVGSSSSPKYQSSYLDYAETVGYRRWEQTVPVGESYRVRCRFFLKKNKKIASEYSDWSSVVATPPTTPVFNDNNTSKLNKVTNDTAEVSIYFSRPSTATSVTIEYTYNSGYFNSNTSEVQTWTSSQFVQGFSHAEIADIDLNKGNSWFFRIKASNDAGDSYWSDPLKLVLGKKPGVPTTWSSTTTAIVGERVNLYWVHNSEDGSSQTSAEIELTINGAKSTVVVENPYINDEENKDKTLFYELDTSSLEDATVQWRVRTAGVLKKVYGDWSITRTIDVHARPTLSVEITDTEGIPLSGVITGFPFYIKGIAGPPTQTPIGYHVDITANEEYEDVDNVGNPITIGEGQSVYSKYFDTHYDLLVVMSATNVNLRGGVGYTLTCVVSMDSGLSATYTKSFSVEWTDETYSLDASIYVDDERGYIASIRPYCYNITEVDGEAVETELTDDVLLSVYRREYDGTFTEIERDIANNGATGVVDKHPALDYARYRIIATSKSTGAISYEDLDWPVECNSIIIQWEEESSPSTFSYDPDIEDELEKQQYAGSMLVLPYNIDVSDSNSTDASLVEYIGRSYPVSYYGTQLKVTSTWNVDIPKDDTETLYAIRRLAIYTGDVYVREPSGSGYWANISVSFNQKHRNLVIPVTFSITRVEGGK